MRYLIFLVLLWLAFACDRAQNDSMAAPEMATEESAELDADGSSQRMATPGEGADEQTGSATAQADTVATPRRIIRTADIRMQVEDVTASTARVQALAQNLGGYLSGQELRNNRYEIVSQLTIRIPAERLDTFLNAMSGESLFTDYATIRAADVTAEWIDVETRLQTKREVRERYIDILRNQARTAEDILNAEEKIRVITEEIEAQEARLRYLRDQVGMSTVNLALYQKTTYRDAPETLKRPFWQQVGNALADGWNFMLELVLVFLRLWPLLILVVIALFAWRARRRR